MQEPKRIDLERLCADGRMVDELYRADLVGAEARAHARALLAPALRWALWAERLLASVGVALALAGVVYFFAFNWAALPRLWKLGIVESVLIACLAAACWRGLERGSGRVLLLGASVLVGVFLAVFGQVYQTGADAWQLFFAWGALIAGWAAITRSAALWVLWLMVMNVFGYLFWQQAVLPPSALEPAIFSLLGGVNAGFLVMRETLAARGASWLGAAWHRLLLAAAVLGCLLVPAVAFIVDAWDAPAALLVGASLCVLAQAVFLWTYSKRVPDMRVLALTVLSICLLAVVACFRLVEEVFPDFEALAFLVMSASTLAVFTAGVVSLRLLARRMETSRA